MTRRRQRLTVLGLTLILIGAVASDDPLVDAAKNSDKSALQALLDDGADVNIANDLGATPIWAASRNGSAAMADKLLEAGADPDAPLLLGETPLVTASRSGNPEVVRMLLEKGADVNARVPRSQILPGQFAELVEFLLQQGPDPNGIGMSAASSLTKSSSVFIQRGPRPSGNPPHEIGRVQRVTVTLT